MVRRLMVPLAVAGFAAAALASSGAAETKQIPVMYLHQQIEVAATPAAVWAYMTHGKSMVAMCPVWKSARNASVNLTKVGDVLDYTDEWGNNGRSVVTTMVKDKELRIAHDPNKGDYMCQAKYVLTPSAKGTVVHYYEQYTDESSPKDMEATAGKMAAEMTQTLAALKKGVEKK